MRGFCPLRPIPDWASARLDIPAPDSTLSRVPHTGAVYRGWLEQLRLAGVHLSAIPARIQNAYTLALRHDIDDNPERIPIFLDAEKEFGVSGAYYFLVQGMAENAHVTYALADQAPLVANIREAGGIVGLHTIAWSQPNGIEVFRRECAAFEKAFGFMPRYWTHHGYFEADDPRHVAGLRLRFELQFMKAFRRQFTPARYGMLSDSNGRDLPVQFPLDRLKPNFPNEIMLHTDYWTR